ncbi:alpha/beta hydrolase [Neorhizobium galegae]|uniref:alpha/beta hydrolase n=1 Tax=Neorhizobium galegae TaxID=399 RepID=UPI00062234C7|nr:alpha/beta hydrolase [Neorhizobium galegae]CDZ60344.1 Hydrolase, alpha/beta domain protein [Neorhizobium galegae bv. orientalis]KAB1120924.1 alpha/beta hydrolase [Neorhizobium galegae]MCQ1574479.1 alpha/beta hydrolase [Neorhizobium galegae]MCQ1810348.1 alpha/beta hydrolase [Neorhizobium galegae]CDZ64550.1 Hydrolase, alpha/beta domain protein [Neorhizobium galegae bv. orientalis]
MITKAEWQRIPLIVSFPETAKYTETYGFAGNSGRVNLEGQLLRGADAPSTTVYVFMHPTSTLQLLPMPTALADAGLHVLCAASRYPKNDTALIMEKVAIDLGKWLDYARGELGYEKVVLVGWSGGGSLSLFYQAQAENPTITHTPAGDEVNLVEASLKPADGVIFIAAHLSRAETLTEWLDPSVLDELDPDLRDPEFDIYSPDCPHQPPYSAEFIQRFRAAQVARNRKITHWALDMLAELKRRGSFEQERAFVVHRTMCDVRWFDGTIDPNDRPIGRSYMGDPRTVNVGPVGLARFTTLRSWLSQWSYDLSNAKGPMNAALIKRSPVLQIENNADEAVPATHNPTIRAALATENKEYMTIPHATHYYLGQPELLKACIDRVIDWSRRQGLLA